jgi:hypothetical protein
MSNKVAGNLNYMRRRNDRTKRKMFEEEPEDEDPAEEDKPSLVAGARAGKSSIEFATFFLS